ncbi:hypothetical protein D0962_29165 [Leptolyngbyaceae cyanobacterium CCMR0082]|uniref:Uncharacterized protein n=1 Tax=Adonisia turfae CCMR0082 TaxID=2304604 RepID=A0A6M0SE61_9CYAN|nr:hypothetical protein [Adonisia turfae]MDV3352037.1 hypothetical protein [Leptothoe sp. LEGE 181152]NEZ66779.1 hypothetical protein [Adonisia turfae CCMR0082]
MTTQPFRLEQQQVPQASSALAIMFFLLGMPNFYVALQHRSQHQRSAMSFLPVKEIVLFGVAAGGTLSWLMF